MAVRTSRWFGLSGGAAVLSASALAAGLVLASSATVRAGEHSSPARAVSAAMVDRPREPADPRVSLEIEPGELTLFHADGTRIHETSLPCVVDRPGVDGVVRVSVVTDQGVEALAPVDGDTGCGNAARGYVLGKDTIGLCPGVCDARRDDPDARLLVEVYGN